MQMKTILFWRMILQVGIVQSEALMLRDHTKIFV